MFWHSSIDRVVERLQSSSEKKRLWALDKLWTMRRKDLDEEDGLRALEAAAGTYDSVERDHRDPSAELILLAAEWPEFEYYEQVRKYYRDYNTSARAAALLLLARAEEKEAAELFVELVRRHGWPDTPGEYIDPTHPLENHPHYPEVFFPALLEILLGQETELWAISLCLSYCKAGLLKKEALASQSEAILDGWIRAAKEADEHVTGQGTAWRFEKTYFHYTGFAAALLLEVMGWCTADVVVPALREALNRIDPHHRCMAACSLVHLEQPVDQLIIEEIASDVWARGPLYTQLHELDCVLQIPESLRTQEKLAESELAMFLCHPDAMSDIPERIELAERIEIDADDGSGIIGEYYVFRFYSNRWDCSEWMCGVAGPYYKGDEPEYGYGFAIGGRFVYSDCKPMGDRTPEECLVEWCGSFRTGATLRSTLRGSKEHQ